MNNKIVKIVFKDNTSTTFKDKDVWLSDIVDEIKHAMALKLPYILNSQGDKDYDDALIIPIENIKYIQIIDTPNKLKKEHEDGKQD